MSLRFPFREEWGRPGRGHREFGVCGEVIEIRFVGAGPQARQGKAMGDKSSGGI